MNPGFGGYVGHASSPLLSSTPNTKWLGLSLYRTNSISMKLIVTVWIPLLALNLVICFNVLATLFLSMLLDSSQKDFYTVVFVDIKLQNSLDHKLCKLIQQMSGTPLGTPANRHPWTHRSLSFWFMLRTSSWASLEQVLWIQSIECWRIVLIEFWVST